MALKGPHNGAHTCFFLVCQGSDVERGAWKFTDVNNAYLVVIWACAYEVGIDSGPVNRVDVMTVNVKKLGHWVVLLDFLLTKWAHTLSFSTGAACLIIWLGCDVVGAFSPSVPE